MGLTGQPLIEPPPTAIAEVGLHFWETDVHAPGVRLRTWNLAGRFSRLVALFKRVVERCMADDCTNLAAQMSFYFVLSLVPFFLVLAALVGWIPTTNLWHDLVEWMTMYLPAGSRRVIFTVVLDLTHGYTKFLSIGLLVTIWSASSGFISLMEALSIAHGGRETRNYWKRRIIAIVATLAAAIFFLLGFALTAAGRIVASFLSNQYSTFAVFRVHWDIVRWAANLLLILIAVDLVYYFLPNVKRSWHWITVGSAFVTLAFFLASIGFDFYIKHASNIPKVYGTLAGFIIFLIWIYIANMILLIGAETDRVIRELRDAGVTA
jgi:membrane protein